MQVAQQRQASKSAPPHHIAANLKPPLGRRLPITQRARKKKGKASISTSFGARCALPLLSLHLPSSFHHPTELVNQQDTVPNIHLHAGSSHTQFHSIPWALTSYAQHTHTHTASRHYPDTPNTLTFRRQKSLLRARVRDCALLLLLLLFQQIPSATQAFLFFLVRSLRVPPEINKRG